MLNPSLTVKLVSTKTEARSAPTNSEGREDITGRDVSAVVMGTSFHNIYQGAECAVEPDEMQMCSSLGHLLHFVFSGEQVFLPRNGISDDGIMNEYHTMQPAKKQTRESSFSQASICSGSYIADTRNGNEIEKAGLRLPSLTDYGYPSSVSRLVEDLISCEDGLFRADNVFKSLNEATDEVHLLLQEPTVFLFGRAQQSKHILSIGSRLFGRSVELLKIVGAFHRVSSSGRTEVIVIGGHSGSGKSE